MMSIVPYDPLQLNATPHEIYCFLPLHDLCFYHIEQPQQQDIKKGILRNVTVTNKADWAKKVQFKHKKLQVTT